MRRLLLLLPLAFLFAPGADQDNTNTSIAGELKAFNDDPKVELAQADEMEKLAKQDPVGFLENCLRRYKRTVKGYTLTFEKQERLGGKIQPTEIIAATFRQEPFSVRFKWEKGAGLADAVAYVEGENIDKVDNKNKSMMLVRPTGFLAKIKPSVQRDPNGKDAQKSSRYAITEFGLEKGTVRTWNTWKAAQEAGQLHVAYEGVVTVKEAGDRPCYKLHRTQYAKPEEDGVSELTLYVDKETWLQVGSELKTEDGKWIARYFFRDIVLNPEFPGDAFKEAGLK